MAASTHESGLSRLLHSCRRRFSKRSQAVDASTDSEGKREQEQSLIRVVMGGIVILYMLATHFDGPTSTASLTIAWVAALFFSGSLLLLVAVFRGSSPSPTRRYSGILLDLSATSAAMAVSGEAGAPLLGIYLWVILGNGFRYGSHYLAVAAGVGLIGFTGVAIYSDYWRAHPLLSSSYLLVLLLIPAYVAALLGKLRKAIRHANEASSAKSEFLAKMSHELRTPLNGVIGMSDLLMDSQIGHQEREFVKTIHNSGKVLLGVIDNILDFSKIESGRLPIEHIDLDVHRLVAETVAMFAPQASRKGIGLTTRFDPRVPFALRGDPLHIRQVLLNLLGNAIKFTETGSIEVRVSAANDDDERQPDDPLKLRFEIEDTGVGIAVEDQAHVFESFRQARADTARRFGGTGLGTAIAHELVTLMGGRIGLSSQPGHGSLFWFELPLALIPVPAHERERGLANERVLVIGVGHQAEVLLETLAAMGMHVMGAESAADAARKATHAIGSGQPFGLLLFLEPEFDPDSFSAVLEKDSMPAETLCFVLSAITPTQQFPVFRVGCDGVLSLPLCRDELLNALHAGRSVRALPENVVSLAEHYRRLVPAEAPRLHILVAEDNDTNRRVLRAILERAGHRLTVVDDGEAALDAIQENTDAFDLMILDKNMPERSGLDVFRAQRFMYPQTPIPTIMLSADATDIALKNCLEAGVDAYLTKPVESRRLLETIARLGHGTGTRDTSRKAQSKREIQYEPDSVLLDLDKLESLRRLSDDAHFFDDLVSGFQRDAERSISDIADALTSSDYPALRGAAHALEGSARELGAVGLAGIARSFRGLKPFELRSTRAQQLLGRLRDNLAMTSQRLTESVSDTKDDQAH
ncbi:MAG: ATP-binding protein [Thiohalocapsa sp.]